MIEEKSFWQDQKKAKEVIKEKNQFEKITSSYLKASTDINDVKELYSLSLKENNQEVITDCEKKIELIFLDLRNAQVNCFLSGKNDNLDIFRNTCRSRRNGESRLGSNAKKNVS